MKQFSVKLFVILICSSFVYSGNARVNNDVTKVYVAFKTHQSLNR